MYKKSALVSAVALSLGVSSASAAVYRMTFMDFPGAPNTTVVGTLDTSVPSGMLNSGATPFFGHAWTGTLVYGLDNTTTGTITGAFSYSMASGASATGSYSFSLAPGQSAMGILFTWKIHTGIPVLNIVNADGSGVDIDGDGTLGTIMQNGPFAGTPVGFSGQAVVPVPAAVWLMGSGLLGLVGVARRRIN